jgi:8-amino-7-oxononanoate synthase
VAAAARASLAVLGREPDRPERARALAGRLAAGLASAGYRVALPAAAIVPVVVGEAADAVSLSAALLEAGVLVTAIRPPTVPPGTSRLWATVMATHTDAHLARAVEAFRRAGPPGG